MKLYICGAGMTCPWPCRLQGVRVGGCRLLWGWRLGRGPVLSCFRRPPSLWATDLVREAPVDRSSLANCWQAGACAGLIVCQIKGWVPLQPTEAKRATPGSGPHDGGCGGSRGRGGARSAPRGRGRSRGSVRADTWLSLQPLALYPQVAHAVGTAGAPGAQLEFAPAPGVRAVLAGLLVFLEKL